MSFDHSSILSKQIRKVLHIGADRGGELPQYKEMGVEEVVWVEANPEVYGELLENLEITLLIFIYIQPLQIKNFF